MASRPSREFRAEAVRVVLTSGLSRKQVAADFGVGRLIRQNGISVKRSKKFKATTEPAPTKVAKTQQ